MYYLNFSLSALGCPQPKDAEYGASQTADFEASSACRVAGNGEALAMCLCFSKNKNGKGILTNAMLSVSLILPLIEKIFGL